ncbi:MAG: LptA/OstA family protein [Hyphomicrobiales bacterium]
MNSRRLFLACACALALMGTGARAQGATGGAPQATDIEADQMEVIDAQKKAIFRGNVNARRGDITLKSQELVVLYADVKQPDGTSKTDATEIDAKGNVIITTPKEQITGDTATIDVQKNILVVLGNVKLVQGSTILTGPELRADLKNNKMEMKGGRVKGSFLPK